MRTRSVQLFSISISCFNPSEDGRAVLSDEPDADERACTITLAAAGERWWWRWGQ
jgi:hypothetical protein